MVQITYNTYDCVTAFSHCHYLPTFYLQTPKLLISYSQLGLTYVAELFIHLVTFTLILAITPSTLL